MHVRISTGLVMLGLAVMMTGCQVPVARTGIPVSNNLPTTQMPSRGGPGVAGPGPGVIMTAGYSNAGMQAGEAGMVSAGAQQNVQVLFSKPEAMQVNWDVSGVGMYDSAPLPVPGRQNFAQGGIYRLKISNINGHPGLELYPTMEMGNVSPRTAAYLAHAAVPVQFTQEDFDQVSAGNFVTKVIYVPDPAYQELALSGVDTLVSTRLDPGVDPVVEADRRGAILAIIRVGNKDLEMPGTDPGAMAVTATGGVGGVRPDQYISGVNGPAYGMPITSTQIGLPGPPHLPMGAPASVQAYNVTNNAMTTAPGRPHSYDVHLQNNAVNRPGRLLKRRR